jgi:16S rRNA (cytidine1402-2'-O)-methyltransferase
MKRIPAIIDRLQQGESFALVSDRGMPTVSDPGAELVAECHRAEIAVSVIPGPSALTVAFAGSGYPHPFVFWGFLPSHGKERRMAIDRLATNVLTQIIYEAPHRLEATLSDLRDALGGGHGLTIARELTKPYEEFWQGPIDEALSSVPRFRGELVLVLAPLPQAAEPARLAAPSPALWQALEVLVEDYIREGQSESEAIRRVAAQFRVARRALYERVVRAKQVTD